MVGRLKGQIGPSLVISLYGRAASRQQMAPYCPHVFRDLRKDSINVANLETSDSTIPFSQPLAIFTKVDDVDGPKERLPK